MFGSRETITSAPAGGRGRTGIYTKRQVNGNRMTVKNGSATQAFLVDVGSCAWVCVCVCSTRQSRATQAYPHVFPGFPTVSFLFPQISLTVIYHMLLVLFLRPPLLLCIILELVLAFALPWLLPSLALILKNNLQRTVSCVAFSLTLSFLSSSGVGGASVSSSSSLSLPPVIPLPAAPPPNPPAEEAAPVPAVMLPLT